MTSKNNKFSFKHIEDIATRTNETDIDFGFKIFASYLKLASLFQILENSMWLPTDLIYEEIAEEGAPNEALYDIIHEYVDAYVSKGIFEKSVITERFANACKDTLSFNCNEMIRMVNVDDVETLRRFSNLISLEVA